VFDNLAKVMIEIQHKEHFILVVNETMFLDNGFKLFEVQVINVLGNQVLNNFLKVKPPEAQIMKGN